MNETEILQRIARGDTDKFGLIYDAYAERIYRYLFYRTRNKRTAEDLTSTTFLKAIKGIQSFDARKGNLSAWLYRIARNTLLDHIRVEHPSDSIDDFGDVLPSGTNLERETIDRELIKKVKDSFKDLSEDQREIVTLRVWDELTYPEIAKITGKSEASCKMSFYRATEKLRGLAALSAVFLILFSSLGKLK